MKGHPGMKIHAVAFVLFVVLGCAGFAAENNFALKTVPAACEAIPGTRMRVDWQRLISRYNIELPVLPDNHTESLRLGNGDIGAAVYSVPECLVLFVGKNDLLDYRTKPLAHSPEATAMSNAAVPMPTTKPAGWLRFRNATPTDPKSEGTTRYLERRSQHPRCQSADARVAGVRG